MDTSAIVAILSDEEDAGEFLKSIENASFPITSALVVLEAAMRLTTKLRTDPGTALREIETLLNESRVAIIPIEAEHGPIAVAAVAEFGKGRGHPAQLNLADCLSYASPRAAAFRFFTRATIFPAPT
ncbi:PIN domain-containing protein [Mesorhizobium sp. AaZ16]|uniref:PIN domain-containing protein n=1 Tax=Mesorhizobium sp. AaZ16 TaxID=3402289 RepID=UPI00374E7585